MRLFKDGRTETVRSCSIESSEFVKAMKNPDASDSERFELLRKACDRHQDYYRTAMAGQGCDRHLFAMYVVSKYLQISSPFLDHVFNMPFELSTSQTPQHQMPEYSPALNKEKELFWPAGGFCCPDGSNYGVCYTISGPGDCLSFHVSTWKSLSHTVSYHFHLLYYNLIFSNFQNAQRYLDTVVESLRDIKTMVEQVKN